MESNYHRKNTYHNSTHAADVLQGTAYLVRAFQSSKSEAHEVELSSYLLPKFSLSVLLCLSVCFCFSVSLYLCLLSICLSVSHSLSLRLSLSVSLCLSISLYVSICLSICLSVCLSVLEYRIMILKLFNKKSILNNI